MDTGVICIFDYFPFGMQMPGRKGNTGEYRYGFNVKDAYNPETGILENVSLNEGSELTPGSFQDQIFTAINKEEMFTIKSHSSNKSSGILFKGNNSISIGEHILKNPNITVVQKVLATDIARFNGVSSSRAYIMNYYMNFDGDNEKVRASGANRYGFRVNNKEIETEYRTIGNVYDANPWFHQSHKLIK